MPRLEEIDRLRSLIADALRYDLEDGNAPSAEEIASALLTTTQNVLVTMIKVSKPTATTFVRGKVIDCLMDVVNEVATTHVKGEAQEVRH